MKTPMNLGFEGSAPASARAGDPEPDGTLVPDVKVGAWQMPWNARPDATRLAPGVPPAPFWRSDPNGINQVGCVYTAQGFEFDYVGVIFGRDLRWDPTAQDWIGDRFTDLVKRIYRVLLARGMQGCYVYFEDAATKEFVSQRMGRVPTVLEKSDGVGSSAT